MPRFYFQVSGWFYAFLGMFALLGISFLTLLQSQSPQENETSVQVYTLGVPATSIQDIFALEPTIWQQEKANQLNFGYTNKPVWLLVSEGAFVNELSIVELKFPQLDFVDFYVVDLETGAVVDHQL